MCSLETDLGNEIFVEKGAATLDYGYNLLKSMSKAGNKVDSKFSGSEFRNVDLGRTVTRAKKRLIVSRSSRIRMGLGVIKQLGLDMEDLIALFTECMRQPDVERKEECAQCLFKEVAFADLEKRFDGQQAVLEQQRSQ